jgi:GT2 family glycosyltransferase
MSPSVSIIYVYYNTPKEIVASLKSLPASVKNLSYEVIVIDNLSPTPLPKEVSTFPHVKAIINKENRGYGGALNQGSKVAKGKYLLLLNPDTVFLKDSVSLMVEKMEKDTSVGILGPQLLDENQKVSITGNGMPFLPDALFAFSFLNKFFPNNPFSKRYYLTEIDRIHEKEFPVICGACMLIKKSLFEKIGCFDEQFFMYFEESDLCYRVKKAGYRVLYYPKAKMIHLGGKSSDNKLWIRKVFEESRYKFFKKYHNPVAAFLGEAFLRIANNITKFL